MQDQESAAGIVLIAVFALAIYFFPTLIAWARGNRQTTAIFILNLLLGWSFFGWAVALVWAFIKSAPPSQPIQYGSPTSLGPANEPHSTREPEL